ncbi:hypothetical protein D4R49_01990 [bacterium]|nr:MAG: hypothetical protein D4R49_01990 [bacterium]
MSAENHEKHMQEFMKIEGDLNKGFDMMLDVNKNRTELGQASQDRHQRLRELQPSFDDRSTIKRDLEKFDEKISNVREHANEVPPEWIANIDKAKQIQSEIHSKLAELEELFKLQGSEFVK